jgi:3-oxoacyl-ACP reductase-like protein
VGVRSNLTTFKVKFVPLMGVDKGSIDVQILNGLLSVGAYITITTAEQMTNRMGLRDRVLQFYYNN